MTVFAIDDDDEMRASLRLLFQSVGHAVEDFPRATDFLARASKEPEGCILADVRMPGMDGLAFLRRLKADGIDLPVILVSGYADVALGVEAMREGAFSFLTKPFREQEMLETVADALATERASRLPRQRDRAARAAYETLDPRERVIMAEIANGTRNKVIAARLGLSEITIKVARARILTKMGVDSAAQLGRLAERLGLE